MLLTINDQGIYCAQGDFYIDPWKPVGKALITHAHSDHARLGMGKYLAHPHSIAVMRARIGLDIKVEGIAYGETRNLNGVQVSFHPAGHVPGSAQIRVEYKGEVWVASGDYKVEPDGLSLAFEPIKCDTFISESTFGLPVFAWRPQEEVFSEINQWWKGCREAGKTAILFCYAFGKAQRILMNLNYRIGPVMCHGAIWNVNEVLRQAGIELPELPLITKYTDKASWKGGLLLAPPSALGSSWMKKFAPYETGTASGWMALRGTRRRRNVDRGFVLSDHADWAGLNHAIEATGAERVLVTHGYTSQFAKWLSDKGLDAHAVTTEFEGELEEIGEGGQVEGINPPTE